MANMDISPEDREMLAKTKFKQWFDECFAETFGSAFDGRLTEISKLSPGSSSSAEGTTGTTASGKTADDAKPRRSLLSMSLEQALGL